MTGRGGWHRRVGWLPLGYLVGIVAIGLAHPFLAQWWWLGIHVLLLGAVTNAILIWSAHFTLAVLRAPAPASRRGEALRLAALNLGIVAVLAGGSADLGWVGVGGAAVVFAVICSHLHWLRIRLRAALPAPYAKTVHYYVAASVALLTGIPVGAWMLVADTALRPRLVLFHAHVNLLGWVTLTVLGTLLTLWPTVLRTRVVDGAVEATRAGLPVAVAGLGVLAVGVLAWSPLAAVGGLVLLAVAAVAVLGPAARTARRKPPASFAAWSMAAAALWLLVALGVDAVVLATSGTPEAAAERFGSVLVPLLIGFVAQTLIGALSYLLPVGLGGGPGQVRGADAALDRNGPQRVVMANLALAVFLLPVGAYVRITASLLVLVALVQFLIPAVRLVWVRAGRLVRRSRSHPMEPSDVDAASARPRSSLGGVGLGVGLVVLAILIGVTAGRVTESSTSAPAADAVPWNGHVTTVAVVADNMRYQPAHITVPAGDRLVIELTNNDNRRHDLVLANGAKTDTVGQGQTVHLDAGVIGGSVEGWCSLPGHRQAGMTLTITATGGTGHDHTAPSTSDTAPRIDAMADPGPGFVARDATAPATPADRVHRIELHVQEVVAEVAPGVRQQLWTFNGTAPGPVLRGRVGDTFEITLVNDGSIDHGVDFHAGALAPDEPMRPIEPGQRLTFRFTATKAGIWMYHCSTMPMLMHVANGMYGAVIIDPPDLAPVDHEYVLVQSEFYLGPDGQPGDLAKMQADQPDAVVFNGYVSQYASRPLTASPGQRVRFWVLDAGPNRASAFHIVGAPFDTVYREGHYELRPTDPGGAQILDLQPASGGFVEAVLPEAGHYSFLSHIMADAERGARGTITVQ